LRHCHLRLPFNGSLRFELFPLRSLRCLRSLAARLLLSLGAYLRLELFSLLLR
jgi:hypothetical protein